MDDRRSLGTVGAVHVLIAVNVVLFLLADGLLSPGNPLERRLPLYLPGNPEFGAWQFLTHMFMHGNFSHLLMNMIGLFMFGSVLERIWGAKRFLIFYLATGVGAGLIFSAVTTWEFRSDIDRLVGNGVEKEAVLTALEEEDPRAYVAKLTEEDPAAFYRSASPKQIIEPWLRLYTPVVGASGAIYGVLTAFGILFPNAKLALIFLPVPVAAKYFIPALLLLDLFSGVTGFSIFGGGIAHFAHLGGALIGFLLMLFWRGRNRESRGY